VWKVRGVPDNPSAWLMTAAKRRTIDVVRREATARTFAPELAIPAVLSMHSRYGKYIYADYGFLDAFNPSFDFDIPLAHGRCIPGFGWVAGDYIGIDQGAIFAMIENYRSGMVWNVMHENKYIRHGLDRAGFSGGWLSASK